MLCVALIRNESDGRGRDLCRLLCFRRLVNDARAGYRWLDGNRQVCRCFDSRRRRLDDAAAAACASDVCRSLDDSCRSFGGWHGSTAATTGRRSCGCGCPRALLALPPRSNPGDLVVRERADMAPHGHIHLTKESDHLVNGYPEFACHVVNAKLAQNLPP
jgi:hypothetical protein